MALHSDGGFPVTANSMPELVARSEVIVVAQVSGIAEVINMSRDQVNPDVPDPNDFEIGQIYNLTVQRYLKGGGDNAIKIMQAEGGILLNQATPSPDIIKEAKSYDNYFHVHFQTGVKYLFFLKSLKAFYGKDYFNGAIHPWVWSLPDGGNAGPLTATEYIGANFPSKPSANLLLDVQQVVSQNPTIPARPNTATLIPTTPPSNTTPAPNGNGIPAIKPNPGLAAPDAVNVPAFTEADVRQYISQVHPEWGLLRPEGPVTIDSVEFLANKDVDKRLGKSSVSGMTGVGGDGLVCLVTGHGKIANRGAGGMPGTPPANQSQTPTPATTFAKAYWVFDIKTGNLLMMGGYGN